MTELSANDLDVSILLQLPVLYTEEPCRTLPRHVVHPHPQADLACKLEHACVVSRSSVLC